jgi:hypothetical protein
LEWQKEEGETGISESRSLSRILEYEEVIGFSVEDEQDILVLAILIALDYIVRLYRRIRPYRATVCDLLKMEENEKPLFELTKIMEESV